MAAAGIVTGDAGPFTGMTAGSPPAVRDLALAARALIFEIAPRTVEVVWPRQRTAGYGTGPKKLSQHFCWLAPYTHHLTFGFFYGSELPDPTGILEPAEHVPGPCLPRPRVTVRLEVGAPLTGRTAAACAPPLHRNGRTIRWRSAEVASRGRRHPAALAPRCPTDVVRRGGGTRRFRPRVGTDARLGRGPS